MQFQCSYGWYTGIYTPEYIVYLVPGTVAMVCGLWLQQEYNEMSL